MIYITYLDEFGHIGPYVSRTDPRYKESPVFGLAGIIMPACQVRQFATWFFKRKCELLHFEIERSGEHPARWEKKGSQLYTLRNVMRYPQLRHFTHRLLNKIKAMGGHVFFTGTRKFWPVGELNSKALYHLCLRESLKRLDHFCEDEHERAARMLVILDEHEDHQHLLERAAAEMFGGDEPRRHILEPPFQAESHMYQTLQAADWIAGLVGRIGCIWASPEEFLPEYAPFRHFERHLLDTAIRSGIKTATKIP